jgi:hypothetical protein
MDSQKKPIDVASMYKVLGRFAATHNLKLKESDKRTLDEFADKPTPSDNPKKFQPEVESFINEHFPMGMFETAEVMDDPTIWKRRADFAKIYNEEPDPVKRKQRVDEYFEKF